MGSGRPNVHDYRFLFSLTVFTCDDTPGCKIAVSANVDNVGDPHYESAAGRFRDKLFSDRACIPLTFG